MRRPTWRQSIARTAVLVVVVVISVTVLTYFGFRAVRGWNQSARQLLEQRARGAADLLVNALTRDMHAVQRAVLSTSDWEPFRQDSLVEVRSLVANAFAKYPYPECFLALRDNQTPRSLVFFTRSDRRPPWAAARTAADRFPVTESTDAALSEQLLKRVDQDAATGQRFSLFETRIYDVPYQVVIHLRYASELHDHVDGLFGFMVNLEWARDHYFESLTNQIASIDPSTAGLILAVLDEHGRTVASTAEFRASDALALRRLPISFFDPLLAAVGQPPDLPEREWQVAVMAGPNTTELQPANATLLFMGCAAVALIVGLVTTVRAVEAGARLADLRSEFISTVTHELKTPIAAIRAISETMASGRIASPAGQREYAQLAVQQTKRLSRIVDNLLALSRITDVTEVYSFEPLALDYLVERTFESFREQLREGGFETHLELPPDLPLIQGDQTAVGLLLDNLIDNAIRYSPPGRREIRVRASKRDDSTVLLQISDRGRGIPEDEVAHVTRKFFRGRQLGSPGSGLGLAIVKRIVADHQGEMEISSAVDEGTVVTISFPIAWRHEEASAYS
jgi:signal transduction histidine kinase